MTNTTPLVTIVTPSFNQAEYLEATLRSVVEQDYPNIEFIVVDGGSTDGSVDIIKRYADKLAWWVSEPDRGHMDALNKGYARATGEILAWINSDDILYPGAVREGVEAMLAHPDAAMVYGEADYIDPQGRVIGRFRARQTDYKRLLQGYVHIPQQSTFFRTKHYRQVGPLNEDYWFAFDYDLWVRLAKVAPLVYLPGRLWSAYRLHGASKTTTADSRCWPDMLRIQRREGGSWFSVFQARYMVRKVVAPYITWRRRRMFEARG